MYLKVIREGVQYPIFQIYAFTQPSNFALSCPSLDATFGIPQRQLSYEGRHNCQVQKNRLLVTQI